MLPRAVIRRRGRSCGMKGCRSNRLVRAGFFFNEACNLIGGDGTGILFGLRSLKFIYSYSRNNLRTVAVACLISNEQYLGRMPSIFMTVVLLAKESGY